MSMRIATSQMFDRPMSLMASLTQKADALQSQVSTNKRISAPSDDAAAYVQLDGLKRAGAADAAYSSNVKLAQGLLQQTDTALEGVQTQLQRVQELAVTAANGTVGGQNRDAIVNSIDEITADLLSLANTTDVRGQPLFAGATGSAAYVQAGDGTISFAGSGDPAAMPVGDGDTVYPTVSGERAFGDMFAVLTALRDAIAGGGDTGSAVDGLKDTLDQVSAARASVGARGVRLDLIAERMTSSAAAREETRSGLEDTDMTTAIAELQKTLTVLQATQASFTKLSSLSLFDYLR